MAANELKERLIAACWVQCGGGDVEAINALDNSRIRFRSLVGFQQRIITTTNPQQMPVLILPLDRTCSRSESAVFATRIGTAGPALTFTNRAVYPDLLAPVPDVPQVFVQPILLEWLGPDLSNPTFFPFGILTGSPPGVVPRAPPVGANLNLFDAIAVLLPADVSLPAAVGQSGDFCVMVLKHPPLELTTSVEDVLPAGPEDVFALLRAWFRADTFTESGGDLASLDGRVGGEGDLVVGEGFGLPVPDPLLNNQDVTPPENNAMSSTAPAGFWDFMATGSFTFYGVAYPTIDNESENLWQYGSLLFSLLPSSTDGELLAALGSWGSSQLEYPDSDINVGQWFKIIVDEALPATGLQLVSTAAGTATPEPVGAPPGPQGMQLQVMGSGGSNELRIAELMWWDFALSPAQQLEVETYLNTRYGTPIPPADPILALEPTAWFRGDTFTQSGGFTQALTGRVGTEGNMVAQIASYALPAAQGVANGQLGLQYGDQANNNLVSSMPAAFWDFLQTENTWFGAVFLVPGVGIQRLFTTAADDIAYEVDLVLENSTIQWGVAGANASFGLGYPAAEIGNKQTFQARQDAAEAQPITVSLFPAFGQNGGNFAVAPPGTVAAPLQLGNTTGGAQLGAIVLLDLIFFDRALSSGEIAVWDTYISDRYGVF